MEFDQGWQLHEYEHAAQTPKCTMAAPLTLVKYNVRTEYFLQSARPAHTALQHAPRVLPLANVMQTSVMQYTWVIANNLFIARCLHDGSMNVSVCGGIVQSQPGLQHSKRLPRSER